MIIKLQPPYSLDWRKGYLLENKRTGRRVVTLFNNRDCRSSTPYCRYLLAVKLGRYLSEQEQADHKDNDKTNDTPSNLQPLTPLENTRKYHNEIRSRYCV